MIQSVVVKVKKDKSRDELQVVNLLDEVVLETEKSQSRLLCQDRDSMQSSSVKIDPVWIFCTFFLSSLHSDSLLLCNKPVVGVSHRVLGRHGHLEDGDDEVAYPPALTPLDMSQIHDDFDDNDDDDDDVYDCH